MYRCSPCLGPWDPGPSHKFDMFIQTVYLLVTYSCSGCNFESFVISVSKMNAQFQGCWHKKELVRDTRTMCMAIIDSNGKEILFIILATISIFQNEKFSL